MREPIVSQVEDQLAQFVVFILDQERFALPVEQARGIERWRNPTRIPGTATAIMGIINQRGVLLTVVDMRVVLGMKPITPTRRSRFLLVHEQIDCAIAVDQVIDMLTLDVSLAEPTPHRGTVASRGLLPTPFGFATWLDLNALLGSING